MKPSEHANDEVSVRLKQLQNKIKSLKIHGNDLAKVHSLRSLKKQSKCTKYGLTIVGIVVVILGVVIGKFVMDIKRMSNKDIVNYYFNNILSRETEDEMCIVEVPDSLVDVLRPPFNCSVCADISSIETVTNITQSEFEDRYAYTSRPVVILNATDNWSAQRSFNFKFFKDLYKTDSPALVHLESNCQFFPYNTKFRNLGEVLNMSVEEAYMENTQSKPWYIGWSNCDSSAANVLRQHYQKPYFLPQTSESSKTDWIFMGVPGYGAPIHIDNVHNPSWQAQITGLKKWILEPPPECYHACVSRLEVTLHPGEIIVVDTNRWFHGTEVLGDEISIVIGSEFD